MAACPRLVERRCHDARHVVEQRATSDLELSAVEHHVTAGAAEMDAGGVAPNRWTPCPRLLDDECGSGQREYQQT
jgi:hypothetical protein